MPSYWEILRSNTFFGKETKIGFAVLAPKRWQWDIDNKVTYFNEEQRLLKLIVVEKGRLFLNGIPLTTTTMNQPGKYDNYYLYVIDREGKIFVTPKQINSENKIYHSSLLAGGTVLCAGYLKVENGFLKEIDNGSIHYNYPNSSCMFKLLSHLRKNGLDLNSFSVRFYHKELGPPTLYHTALKFLEDFPYVDLIEAPSSSSTTTTNSIIKIF